MHILRDEHDGEWVGLNELLRRLAVDAAELSGIPRNKGIAERIRMALELIHELNPEPRWCRRLP